MVFSRLRFHLGKIPSDQNPHSEARRVTLLGIDSHPKFSNEPALLLEGMPLRLVRVSLFGTYEAVPLLATSKPKQYTKISTLRNEMNEKSSKPKAQLGARS